MKTRYALYAIPGPRTPLAILGSALLGRDSETGLPVSQSPLWNIPQSVSHRLTAEPRRYGLHATLKAPFRLKNGMGEPDILAYAGKFAAHTPPVTLPGLRIEYMDAFFALVPECATVSEQQAARELHYLAAAAVAFFEPLRAALSPLELQKRQPEKLTPRQKTLLEQWGYPFVFDNYRFHITLTGKIEDEKDRKAFTEALAKHFGPVLSQPVTIDSLCVCRQQLCSSNDHVSLKTAPFTLIKRIPLTGNGDMLDYTAMQTASVI